MKEHEEKVIEKAEALTAELERIPALKVFRAQEAADKLERRKAAAARIADLRLDMEATGVLQREIDGMVEKLAEVEKERKALLQEIGNRKAIYYGEKLQIETAIRRQEGVLLESYDTAIDAAEKFFRDTWENLLKKSVVEQERHGKKDLRTETIPVSVFSNYENIKKALIYCRAAIDALGKMKLEPEPNPERIKALRNGIPGADTLQEYKIEKDVSKDDTPGPGLLAAIRQAEDNRSDWAVSRLLKKTGGLLSRH